MVWHGGLASWHALDFGINKHTNFIVEFLLFNSIPLVWLELARLVFLLGLLACFTSVLFGWFGCLFYFCLFCCALLAGFALL